MGKVIVITSGKGGVGKSTSSVNIATALAMNKKKVLLIDGDIGLRNLDVLLGLENRIIYDIVDVVEGRCPINKAFIRDRKTPNLILLPASQSHDKDAIKAHQMKELIEEVKDDFDFVLIDCPAGIEQGFKNAIKAAEEAIIVTTPEVSAIRDADKVVGLLNYFEIYQQKLIINRVKEDMVKSGKMMSTGHVKEILGLDLVGIIPEDDQIVISSSNGEPVIYQDKAPATKAYHDLALRLLGNEVPFKTSDRKNSLLGKLFRKKV